MLTKEQVKTLKTLYFKENLSQREIARRLGVDRRSVARWLDRDIKDRTPHRASPVNKSPGKRFLPFVKEQIAKRGSQRGLTAALFRELKEQDPPFLGYEPISERTLERVVTLAIIQMAEQKHQERRARTAATRRAKAEAQAQAQAQAQEQVQTEAQDQTQVQAQAPAQELAQAQVQAQVQDQTEAPVQAQAQVQVQTEDQAQVQSNLEPSAEPQHASRHQASRLAKRHLNRHICHQRMSLKPE